MRPPSGYPESYNLSARGLEVYVCRGESSDVLGEDNCIDDFPGNVDPVSVDRIDIGRLERDINGEPYLVGRLPVYSVTLNLIPGSSQEIKLLKHIRKVLVVDVASGYDTLKIKPEDACDRSWFMKTRFVRVGKNASYSNGYFIGMTPGYSSTSGGSIAIHMYKFEFSHCEYD